MPTSTGPLGISPRTLVQPQECILGSDGIVSVGPSDVGFFMTSTPQGNQAAFIQKANSEIHKQSLDLGGSVL